MVSPSRRPRRATARSRREQPRCPVGEALRGAAPARPRISLATSSGSSDKVPLGCARPRARRASAASASSKLRGAGASGSPLRRSSPRRCSMARTPGEQQRRWRGREHGRPRGRPTRSIVSISCARSTIGSTPTIADRPLSVCSARNSSRTARGLRLGPCAAPSRSSSEIGVGGARGAPRPRPGTPATNSLTSSASLIGPGRLDRRAGRGPRPGAAPG